MEQSPQFTPQEQNVQPLENTQEKAPRTWSSRVLRPGALAAAGLIGMAGAAEAGNNNDQYGLKAFGLGVATTVINQKVLAGTPAQIRVNPDGTIRVVPNANIQKSVELKVSPGAQQFITDAGLEVSTSPLFIRVANNPDSVIAFKGGTQALLVTESATGLNIKSYYMVNNIPYVMVNPLTVHDVEGKRILKLGQGVSSPVYVQK